MKRSSSRSRAQERHRTWALAYSFIAPVVVLTATFSLLPLGMLAYRSLFAGGVFSTHLAFVGLDNYRGVFQSGGGHAIAVTAIYTAGFLLITVGLGLGVALLLNLPLPGLSRVRAAFVIPLVVPTVATALIWANLFAPQFGLINRILSAIGLPQADFLSSPHLAFLTVLSFGAWQFFGENVILYLAGLKSLPKELIEAASIDGAGPWQRLRYVRLPLLRRQTALVVVISTLTGLQTFTQIYVLTQGGPNGATQTMLYYIFNQGFVQFNTGQADAMGVILFVVSLLITIFQVAIIGRQYG